MSSDRIKNGLRAVVRTLLSPVDYLALYPAKVVAQNADGTLELVPDDTRIPAHSQVPIRLGLPGAEVTIAPGARVLLGFAGGRPELPIATIWESGSVTKLVLAGADIRLGGTNSPEAVALASLVNAQLEALKTTITAWVPVPNDGGLALKTALLVLFATWPAATGSSRTKTEL